MCNSLCALILNLSLLAPSHLSWRYAWHRPILLGSCYLSSSKDLFTVTLKSPNIRTFLFSFTSLLRAWLCLFVWGFTKISASYWPFIGIHFTFDTITFQVITFLLNLAWARMKQFMPLASGFNGSLAFISFTRHTIINKYWYFERSVYNFVLTVSLSIEFTLDNSF